MATKQRCPKCNQLNDLGVSRCAYCHAPLIQICPRCGAARPWYVPQCSQCAARPADAEEFTQLFQEAPRGRLQGRWLVQETLARSGTSAVYRAVDGQNPGVVRALKELNPVALFRAEERRQAERELEHLLARWSALEHPALPQIFGSFRERDRIYVVLEYVPGPSLARLLGEGHGPLPPDLVRNWGAQCAELLAYLHDQEPPLFVPFLAPRHVLVTEEGQIKLVDFGLSHLFAPNLYGPFGSTRGYAAPELAEGLPGPQSDIFALGRLLYALLIGQALEKSPSRMLPLRRAVPGISEALVKAVAKAAHRDPAQRFASARELRRALWDEADGPLAPLADWRRRLPLQRQPMPRARPQAAPEGESMAALGFAPDPRFGPRAEELAPAPQAAPAGEAKLALYPRQFRLTEVRPPEVRRLVLEVHNVGQAEVTGRVTSHVPWLSAPAKTFTLAAGKKAKILLTVRTALLPEGVQEEPQALSVDTNAGHQWVGFTVEQAVGPILEVEPILLDFGVLQGAEERALALMISNRGRQPLTGSVASRVPWLRVGRGEVRCPPGRSATVTVTLLPGQLPRGPQAAPDALVVESDGGQQRIEARAWRPVPELDLGGSHIDLGDVVAGDRVERLLCVGNTGDGPLHGAVQSLLPWLQVSPQQFTCEPGEMVQLTVVADTAALGDGVAEHPQALRVESDGGVGVLSLHVRVRAPRLELGTSRLDFGTVPWGEIREARLTLRNAGSAPLVALLQPLAAWLSVETRQLLCAPQEEKAVLVRADTRPFTRGQELCDIPGVRVMAGAEVVTLPVSLVILQPSLAVEPAEVDFGYIDRLQSETREVLLRNEGTGQLAWQAQTDALWLEITPAEGVCAAGESVVLRLTAYGLGLEEGTTAAQGTLVINSDGGRAKIPLRVGLAAPVLVTDTVWLDLGLSINRQNVSGSVRIFNRGLGVLRGTIRSDQTWLVVQRTSFECAMGRSIEVHVATDMEEFPQDALYGAGTIHIASNGGEAEIQVEVNVAMRPWLEVPADGVILSRAAPDEPWQGRLVLRNVGQALAQVEIRPSTPQLVVSRTLCAIKPGKSVRLVVQAQGLATEAQSTLYLELVSAEQRLRVPVMLVEGLAAIPEGADEEAQPPAAPGKMSA